MAKLTKKYLKENASEFADAMVDGAYDKMADLYNGGCLPEDVMEVVIDDPDDFECYVNFFVAKHFAKMAGYKLVERGK